MRVDNNALVDPEAVPEDDIRRLPRDTAQREKCLHRARNFAAKPLDQDARRFVDRAGLRAEEADRADVGLDLRGRDTGVVGGRWEGFEEPGSCLVDRNIRALRRENGRDQEFVRLRPVEFAVGIWKALFEGRKKFERAGLLRGRLAGKRGIRHGDLQQWRQPLPR